MEMEPSGSLETMAEEECFRDERASFALALFTRANPITSPLNHPLAEGVQVARRII